MPPYFEDEEFGRLTIDGDGVDFLWMVPITEAERQFAVAKGSQALEDRMREAGLSHVLDEGRQSIV
jgi:Suppressor of fused protein (SUFU)